MVGALTPEQKELMAAVAQEWIDSALNNGRPDEEKIKRWVEWIYEFSGFEKPKKILIASSYPGAFALFDKIGIVDQVQTIGRQIGNNIKNRILEEVKKQVKGQISLPYRALAGTLIWDHIMGRVSLVVGKRAWERVDQEINIRISYHWHFGLSSDFWCAFYDFFRRISVVDHAAFEEYIKFKEAGIWDCFLFEDIAVVVTVPKKVRCAMMPEVLHSETEPAIEWNDGHEEHYINDVFFEKELFDKIKNKTLTAKEAIDLKNVEQRTIAMRILGYENILKQLGAKVIDQDGDYELVECQLNDDGNTAARFVKVKCHSTGKETLLRVDPNDAQTNTCMGAVAWTFILGRERYKPEIET